MQCLAVHPTASIALAGDSSDDGTIRAWDWGNQQTVYPGAVNVAFVLKNSNQHPNPPPLHLLWLCPPSVQALMYSSDACSLTPSIRHALSVNPSDVHSLLPSTLTSRACSSHPFFLTPFSPPMDPLAAESSVHLMRASLCVVLSIVNGPVLVSVLGPGNTRRHGRCVFLLCLV